MLDNVLIGYVFVLFILEYIEISWQKGNTIKELLVYNYMVYQFGMFYYFFKHTAFIFILFVIVYTNIINSFTMTLVIMKFIDIGYKLYIIGNINQKGEVYFNKLYNKQDFNLSTPIKYMNMFLYPTILYLGLIGV